MIKTNIKILAEGLQTQIVDYDYLIDDVDSSFYDLSYKKVEQIEKEEYVGSYDYNTDFTDYLLDLFADVTTCHNYKKKQQDIANKIKKRTLGLNSFFYNNHELYKKVQFLANNGEIKYLSKRKGYTAIVLKFYTEHPVMDENQQLLFNHFKQDCKNKYCFRDFELSFKRYFENDGFNGFLKTSKGMDSIKNFRERKLRVNKDFNHKQKKDDLLTPEEINNNQEKDSAPKIVSYEIDEIKDIYVRVDFIKYKLRSIVENAIFLGKLTEILKEINTFNLEVSSISDIEILIYKFSDFICDLYRNYETCFTEKELIPSTETCLMKAFEYLRQNLSILRVSNDIEDMLKAVFPGWKLNTKSYIEDNSLFLTILQRVIINLKFHIKKTMTFLCTSENFLNNPIGKTIFVLPTNMYRNLSFGDSGLEKKETMSTWHPNIEKKHNLLDEILSDFQDSLLLIENATYKEIEKVKNREETVLIEKYIELYEAKKRKGIYSKKLDAIKILILDVRFKEKLCELMNLEKYYAKSELKFKKSVDMKDLAFFIEELYKRYVNPKNPKNPKKTIRLSIKSKEFISLLKGCKPYSTNPPEYFRQILQRIKNKKSVDKTIFNERYLPLLNQ
ncbi:MAG: hypothetical protein BKP49_10525 [Treponema sp. CETP13]|nr:MAG: hypothetical protein BKP49_10525 [Treponema sp. CETP13]